MTTYGPLAYLECGKCGHGGKKQYNWSMPYFDYLFNFIIRECPKCKFLDTNNSMGPIKQKRIAITLEAVDY